MNKHLDGGPAFPSYVFSEEVTSSDHQGMTLRDHFAGMAMAGLSANRRLIDVPVDLITGWAYEQADAMLEARGKAADPNNKRRDDGEQGATIVGLRADLAEARAENARRQVIMRGLHDRLCSADNCALDGESCSAALKEKRDE